MHMLLFQVKPTRAGSSIGVTVAYGVADSLRKAKQIMLEVLQVFPTPVIMLIPLDLLNVDGS